MPMRNLRGQLGPSGAGFGGQNPNHYAPPSALARAQALRTNANLRTYGYQFLGRDRGVDSYMMPCISFINGYCERGHRCRYYHPIGSNITTAFQVPPMPTGFGRQQMRSVRPRIAGNVNENLNINVNLAALRSCEAAGTGACARGPIGRPRLPLDNQLVPGHSSRSLLDAVLENTVSNIRAPRQVQMMQMPVQMQPVINQVEQIQPCLPPPAPAPTLFSHIDWAHFLAPGVAPPPIVIVPEPRPVEKLIEQQVAPIGSGEGNIPSTPAKLSAKLELKLKMKEIAKELAAETEPIPLVRPLDSFFKQFPTASLETLPEIMLIRSPSTTDTESVNEKDATIPIPTIGSSGGSGDMEVGGLVPEILESDRSGCGDMGAGGLTTQTGACDAEGCGDIGPKESAATPSD